MTNRAVLVCAANSGIGLEAAKALLEQGSYEVHSSYRRDGAALERLYAERGLDPVRFVHRLDLSDGDEVMQTLLVIAEHSRFWGLVNFAGVSSARRLARMDWGQSLDVFLGNAQPALVTTQATLRLFAENDLHGGRIIQTSSVVTRRPVVGVVPYVAGKAAIEGIVRSASLEAGALGVTVNAIRLGYFSLGMTRDVPQSILDDVVASTAARRLGNAQDVAALLGYLLHDESAFMTGTVIPLDGGLE